MQGDWQTFKSEGKKEFQPQAKSIKQYAYTEDVNRACRPQMEDAYFCIDGFNENQNTGLFGVFDGHGGMEVVKFANKVMPDVFKKELINCKSNYEKLFNTVFAKTDGQLKMIGASESGSCVCLCYINENQTAYIANVGDTRAVLMKGDFAIRLSYDHKGSDESEQQRVKKAGGIISNNRVQGSLAVTRSLGDFDLKGRKGCISEPYIKSFQIQKDDKYIIIASDGLWDVCDDQKAVDLTKNLQNTEEMTKRLVHYALQQGSRDNISVLILQLN